MVEKFKRIYDYLKDETSVHVFEKRLLFSLTGDKEFLLSLGREYRETVFSDARWTSFYYNLRTKAEKGIVLYAAGCWGQILLNETKNVNWRYVVDRSPEEKEICGIPTLPLEDYLKKDDGEYIVVSSRAFFEEIRGALINSGIDGNRIIDGAILYDLIEGRQYFDLKELEDVRVKDETFVDVGCYDGLSTVAFFDWCKQNGHSICMEPDGRNIDRIKRIFGSKGINDYELIDKGAWSKSGRLFFDNRGDSMSSFLDSGYGDNVVGETVEVEVAAMDDILFDKAVTFIKMDVEGSEYNALCGARRIIEKNKPKLAICVYHKPEDIWEIPEIILDMNPDYRLYLRHYSCGETETVLYAI